MQFRHVYTAAAGVCRSAASLRSSRTMSSKLVKVSAAAGVVLNKLALQPR